MGAKLRIWVPTTGILGISGKFWENAEKWGKKALFWGFPGKVVILCTLKDETMPVIVNLI